MHVALTRISFAMLVHVVALVVGGAGVGCGGPQPGSSGGAQPPAGGEASPSGAGEASPSGAGEAPKGGAGEVPSGAGDAVPSGAGEAPKTVSSAPSNSLACAAGTTMIDKPSATWCERAAQQLEGAFQYRYPDGRPLAEGQIVDGQRAGIFRVWWPDGTPWLVGSYRDGVRDGEWIRINREDKSVTRSTWSRGRQHGRERITLGDGSLFVDQAVDTGALAPDPHVVLRARENVDYDRSTPTLVRSRSRTLKGKSVGLYTSWHDNGSRQCEFWFNWHGLKADISFCWHEDGALRAVYEFDLAGNLVDEVIPR